MLGVGRYDFVIFYCTYIYIYILCRSMLTKSLTNTGVYSELIWLYNYSPCKYSGKIISVTWVSRNNMVRHIVSIGTIYMSYSGMEWLNLFSSKKLNSQLYKFFMWHVRVYYPFAFRINTFINLHSRTSVVVSCVREIPAGEFPEKIWRYPEVPP